MVKSYTIKYSDDDNVKIVKLYFVKKYATDDNYTLFIVRKQLKNSSMKYQAVFADTMSAINSKVKTKGKIYKTNFGGYNDTREDALAALWRLKSSNIILAMHSLQNMWGGPPADLGSDQELIYISNEGWQKYIKGCELYQAKKRQDEIKKNSKILNDL